MASYKLEALWDCVYCGHIGNLGRYRHCPYCGSARTEDVAFYPPTDRSRANAINPSEHKISSGPDWMCEYCGGYASSDALYCPGCGSKRSDATRNYADIQEQKEMEE